MAIVIGTHAQEFIDGLNVKFADYGVFSVNPGKKYDKIVVKTGRGGHGSVYAFVDTDGNVYKAAGWSAPAKGIRYTSVADALVKADPYGSFLYKR
jgi:hypothetical protein